MISFFFFQAEDGIRDGHVTGVQTCALPICSLAWLRERFGRVIPWLSYPYGSFSPGVEEAAVEAGYLGAVTVTPGWTVSPPRSEERRVGNARESAVARDT